MTKVWCREHLCHFSVLLSFLKWPVEKALGGLFEEVVWGFSSWIAVSVFTESFRLSFGYTLMPTQKLRCFCVFVWVCVSNWLCSWFSKNTWPLILKPKQTTHTLTPKINWELLWKSNTCNYYNEERFEKSCNYTRALVRFLGASGNCQPPFSSTSFTWPVQEVLIMETSEIFSLV